MTVPISAYVLTHNNESTIERALKSISFVDELVVVDSYSTDGTIDIVKNYTDNVIQRTWPGFRDQYQFGQDQCTHDWALFIDADEEISEELGKEIREVLEENANLDSEKQIAGFNCQRRTFFLGRWILHGGWVPDREIRLYNRKRGNWKGNLHAKVHIDGEVSEFQNYYYHYTYDDIAAQLRTVNKYSSTASEDLDRDGVKNSRIRMIGNPIFRFIREYFLKRGFLDGMPGFIIAVNNSFYVFNKYAKLWERHNCLPEKTERNRINNRP